ncbi:MAG: LPP20 family lipoprotein, partial [Schleiferiaceae bacterium]
MKKLTFASFILLLLSCGSQKNIVPEWVLSKPIDQSRTYVYGVGMSYINPNAAYQQAARSNALADLAGEVESQIFDETKLLQKEDSGGFSSAFKSETSTKSHIKLEEYEVVETYSDELRYYVLYKLDLPYFLARKAENDAIAMNWIQEKLLIANESSRQLTQRFHALADAIDKAIQRDFLMDPQFKVETQTNFISALRNIEKDIHA